MRGLVLFDFGGTLDADGARWSVRFHSAYRAAGGVEPFAAFEAAFRASDRALERRTDMLCRESFEMRERRDTSLESWGSWLGRLCLRPGSVNRCCPIPTLFSHRALGALG